MHCIIQIVIAIQKYLFIRRHLSAFLTGMLGPFSRASITTFSSHFQKQRRSRKNASTAQIAITLIHAA